MKHFLVVVFSLIVVSTMAFAAPPEQWAGAGATWNQYAAPQINGLAAYARRITGAEHPTYSFSAINILSVSRNPWRVMTTTETGIAQNVGKFGPFTVYALGTAGIAIAGDVDGGTSTGFSSSGGGLAMAGIGKGWTIGPVLRVIKPSIGDRQWSLGCVVGWGK